MNDFQRAALQREAYEAQLEAYRQQQEAANRLSSASKKSGGSILNSLGSVLGGIANSVGNVGKGLADMFGTGAASVRDIVTGNAATGKYSKEWKDYAKGALYGDSGMSDKDYYAKSGGTALDAATTLSDFIPGVGAAGRAAMNIGQGVTSGIAQNYIDNGSNATLEGSLNNALVGGLSAGVGGAVAGKAAKAAAGTGTLSKALQSNVARGALTGAASGAAGAGLQTALSSNPENLSLAQILGNAAQGAAGGALGGAAMGGVMGVTEKAKNSLQNKMWNGATNAAQPQVIAADNATEQRVGSATKRRQQALGWDGEQIDASKRNVLQATGKALEDAGARTKNADIYGKLNNNTARQVEANDTINNLKKNYGYSARDYDKAANLSEATNRWISNEVKSSGASGIDNDLISKVALDDSYVSLTDKQAKSYDKMARKLIGDAQVPGGTIDEYSAAGLYDASEKAGKLANTYYEKSHNKMDGSVTNVELDELSNAYRNLKNETRAAADKMLGGQIDDVTRNNLQKMLQDAGAPKEAIKTLTSAQSLTELKSMTSPLEAARNMNAQINQTMLKRGATTDNATNPVTVTLKKSGATQLVDTAASPIGNAVGNVEQFVGKKISSLGNLANKGSKITQKVSTNVPTGGLLDTIATREISRKAGQSQAERLRNEADLLDAQEAYNIAEQNAILADQQLGAIQQAQQPSSQIEQQMEIIANGMNAALAAGDITSYAKLADLYNDAYSIYATQAKMSGLTSSGSTGSATGSEKLTDNQSKALTGLQQLEQLEQMTPSVSTALANSPLGGVVNLLGGDDYANQAQSLALTLGYLQSGANVSQNEAERIGKSYIPTAYDSEAVRRSKLQRARALLQNYLSGTSYAQ